METSNLVTMTDVIRTRNILYNNGGRRNDGRMRGRSDHLGNKLIPYKRRFKRMNKGFSTLHY